MTDNTKIEWADATWNPVTGCTEVSPGCDNCYAKTFAERWRGTPGHYFEDGFDVVLRPDKLDLPLRWKRPRRIFVNSMSDLFHDDIPDAFIGAVFEVMAQASHHTFQVLTKRHGRMRSLLNRWATNGMDTDGGYLRPPHRPLGTITHTAPLWTPPPNVWLGVSVENQQWADIRIPALLETPAAVRFLSMEPLLGPVDLTPWLWEGYTIRTDYGTGTEHDAAPSYALDWVIVGGESGRGARPMEADWARSLRDQCTAAGVPFLFKQWGEHLTVRTPSGEHRERVGKKAAGRELDGRTWDEFPQAVTP